MDKKEILKQLEEHFREKPKYMGAPSFAYQVKARDEVYTIDREGKIKNTEGTEFNLEELLRVDSKVDSLETITSEVKEAIAAEVQEAEPPVDRMEVVFPMGDHSGLTLRNLINIISSKQNLIQQSLGFKHAILVEEFVKAINDEVIAIIEDFESILLEVGPEKCPGIAFDFKSRMITFKFYKGELEPDKLKAYTDLVALINKNAQSLKHASMKPTATDNPKYSFRTWLLRLGMIGEEYKTTRKVLLANLDGNGAFRNKPTKNEDLACQVEGGQA